MPCLAHTFDDGATCEQGRKDCPRALTCSGAISETDAAIRLHRAMSAPIARDLGVESALPQAFTETPTEPTKKSSGLFFSILIVALLAAAFLTYWR